MDFNGIKELIDEINASNIAYFEYETEEGHVKIDKSLTRNINNSENDAKVVEKTETKKEVEKTVVNDIKQEVQESTTISKDAKTINSPMVGTFYKSSSPDADPFVNVGDSVQKGDVLCIIEAMKLMNEIEAEDNCKIVKVLVNDGEMVEYGQPLFEIEECN